MERKDDSENIRVIAGLGNYGSQYFDNRHNAGFWFIDNIAQQYNTEFSSNKKSNGYHCRININSSPVFLFKSADFINLSGVSLQTFIRYHKVSISQVLVVHDEIDLDVGKVRFKNGGGSGGHKGVQDIIKRLGNQFWRLRIGVGRPRASSQVASYVLTNPDNDERAEINWILDQTIDKLELIVSGQYQEVMNQLHNLQVSD